MKSKVEIDLSPSVCLSCEKCDKCYFGKFFSALKTQNCKLHANPVVCNSCPLRDKCVLSRFENTASHIVVSQNKIFLCENLKK